MYSHKISTIQIGLILKIIFNVVLGEETPEGKLFSLFSRSLIGRFGVTCPELKSTVD